MDEVEVTETTVSYSRQLPAAPLARWEADATGLDPTRSYARRESGLFASPAVHIQRWEIQADGQTYSNVRTHAITPETPNSTAIFMRASRNYAVTSGTAAAVLQSFVGEVVSHDRTVLEMAASRVGYEGWKSSVEFQADAAALQVRHIIDVMMAKEAGRSALRPGVRQARATDVEDSPGSLKSIS